MSKIKLLKVTGALILALIITQWCALPYAGAQTGDIDESNGKVRLIVKFKGFVADRIAFKLGDEESVESDDLDEYILRKIDEKYNLKKLEKLIKDRINAPGGARRFDDYFVIEVDKDAEYVEWMTGRLERFYEIDMVEEDLKVNISSTLLPDVNYIPNDTYVTSDSIYWKEGAWGQSYPDMWGLQKTKAFEAWDLFASPQNDPGKDIVVAVIDTGVAHDHPDVSANMWSNPDEIAGNGTDDDGNGYVDDTIGWDFVNNDNAPYDGHGHGTHCSGTIAAATNNSRGIAGMAPNAKIMALKGLSDSGSGYISWLSNCVLYAADNGADVLSNSWGGSGSSSTLINAMNYAHSKGCVIVAAAGNSNADASGYQPANIPNVITVAATDHNDVKAYFSNYGPMVDISAPGMKILSSTGGGYSSWNGTSMACPHVSGVAALIMSHEPTLTNVEVRERLKSTADDISAQNPNYPTLLGTGRVNAYEAILAGGPQAQAPVLASIGDKAVDEGDTLSFIVSATDADGDSLVYSVYDSLPGSLTASGISDFFIQSDYYYGGSRALQSGAVSKDESTAVSRAVTTLSADGSVSFYWKVSSAQGNGKLAFYIDGAKAAEISGDVDWKAETFPLVTGTYTLKWEYSRSGDSTEGADAGWIDNITLSCGGDKTYDFESGDIPGDFTTGGDGNFYAASGTAHQGTYALKGDASLVDNQSEYVETTFTPPDSATETNISFWWKVSSEYYYDYLEFYIDGVRQERISGETAWQQVSYVVSSPGAHTFRWRYTKDYSVTRGQDTGWVDDIEIGSDTGGTENITFESVQGQPDPLPHGASFDPATRTFTWSPTYQQSGAYPNIRFTVTEVTETARSDYEDISITVYDVNRPPVMDPIGDKSVNEMGLLEFTISATDPEGDTLTYAATGLPENASFDADTHTFSWIPSYQQSGVYEYVHFEVGDGGSAGGAKIDDDAFVAADENTALLLHLDSDTSDSSDRSHIASSLGDAQIDASAMKFGAGSLMLDGSGDYLAVPDHTDWDLFSSDTGSWTVDFWVKHDDYTSVEGYCGQFQDSNNVWQLFHRGSYGIRLYVRSGGVVIADTGYGGEIADTEWHHIALCNIGGQYGIYLDGNQVAHASYSNAGNFNSMFELGRAVATSGWAAYLDGRMDEIRVNHSNVFSAAPDSGLTDSIIVPTSETK